jgi:ribonuclease-3
LERRIGYHFKNRRLLEQALTHRSVADRPHWNYERLEFLGDALLNQLISVHLFKHYPRATEGELTLHRSALVSKDFLARIGETIGLHRHLRVDTGVRIGDPKVRRNLCGDALEALLGALYLEGGPEAARRFVKSKVWRKRREAATIVNYKGRLIELCHQQNLGTPHFRLLRTQGPEHDKKFVVQVQLGGRKFDSAQASNKKAAEQIAAERALRALARESN